MAYKVVKCKDDIYYSCIVDGYSTKEYIINEWAKRNKELGPLCIFKSFYNVANFLNIFREPAILNHIKFLNFLTIKNFKIFKCKYKKSAHNIVWKIEDIGFLNYTICSSLSTLPEGTILCDNVKLIEEINILEVKKFFEGLNKAKEELISKSFEILE